MGVKGLQTFLESHPFMFREVDIVQMASDYRKLQPDVDPVIVVDGNNCLHFWVKKVEWVCGGQWTEYCNILRDFLEAFQKIKVKLVFFFDGLTPSDKREEWLSRRHHQIRQTKDIFSKLKNEMPLGPNMFTIPAALTYAIPIALKFVFHATVYCNVDGECDRTIASFAAQHKCMAILAQDSDYVIYPTAPYISIEHLRLQTMHTRMYCRQSLCRELKISQDILPLFACLVGTDYISRESIEKFHKSIGANKFKGLERIHTIVRCVAEFIAVYTSVSQSNLPEIYDRIAPYVNISCDDFKKGLDVYSLNTTGNSGYIFPGTEKTDAQNFENTYEVLLNKVKNWELLLTVINVICSGREIRTTSLEDVNPLNFPGRTSRDKFSPCALVYRPLRQRIYGLLFDLKDKYIDKCLFVPHTGAMLPKSNTVEEWWVNPSKNDYQGKDIVFPVSLSLPGVVSNATVMYDIITEKGESSDLLHKKWTVFMACLGLTMKITTFQRIPDQYKSLCAVLNYLIQQPDVPIELWEIQAFLVQAIHPTFSDMGFQRQLQVMGMRTLYKLLPYNPRAVHLATLFLRGAEAVLDLLWLCGCPFEIGFGIPWFFFNGKLFHYIYKRMHKDDGVKAELERSGNLILFHQLRDATIEGVPRPSMNVPQKSFNKRFKV